MGSMLFREASMYVSCYHPKLHTVKLLDQSTSNNCSPGKA